MLKVFAIGFHKTGTSSLALALGRLGYRVTGPNGVNDPDIATNALPMARSLVPQFDAFQDNPWPVLFRDLDREYPESRFILTVRDPDAWIGSVVAHFGSRSTPMRAWIYGEGSPAGNEALYRARFIRHNSEVRAHFAGRPADLLVMDLAAGDGWPALCGFLGKPMPPGPFPHANTRAGRERGAPPPRARRGKIGSILGRLLPARS